MRFHRVFAFILSATLRPAIFATPIAEPQLLPRSHVECNTENHLCQVQQTCDNAPSIVAGTIPDPWPSSVPQIANPVSALESRATGASGTLTGRRRKARQPNTARWCALGTEVYVLLALQGTQNAAAIKSILGTAIQQVESQIASQTATKSQAGISDASAPVYSLAGTGSKITANNAAGATMTWMELELGLLTVVDWMGKNTYGWGSASVWNASDEVGLIYLTV